MTHSELAARHPTTASATKGPGKGLNVGLWIVQGLLALAMLVASFGKLSGQPAMVDLFTAVGIGQWFRYVTGLLEGIGAVLLVIPKTRVVGAGLVACVMSGAIVTHLAILHDSPAPPLVLLALAVVVLVLRREEIRRLLGRA